MTERAVIDTSNETKGPSIQESHDALVEEGVIQKDATEGETPGASQGDENGAGGEDRPSWLPKKFKSPEDMAKAYSELEKKLSKGKQEVTSEETQGAAEEAVEAAGLNMGDLQAEYDENGTLSEDSYKALEKAGISKSMVDTYIEGLNAQATLYGQQVRSVVGSQEDYDAMIAWAADNLSEDEIDAFDEAVNSFDVKSAKAAVSGLHARYQLAEGAPPQRRLDGRGVGSDTYESQAQIEADMNNPLYMTDEAFRQKVYAKMARSNI